MTHSEKRLYPSQKAQRDSNFVIQKIVCVLKAHEIIDVTWRQNNQQFVASGVILTYCFSGQALIHIAFDSIYLTKVSGLPLHSYT